MGIAFFTYGIVFVTCAIMTGYFARKREFRRHKNWAIRSYSQILATMLYRYYYAVLGGFGVVYSPDHNGGLSCDEMDVCDYFLKPFDAIHAWTFFIFPLLVAEVVVYLLRDPSTGHPVETPASEVKEDTCNNKEGVTDQVETHDVANPVNNNGDVDKENPKTQASSQESGNATNYFHLNVFGIIFGLICLASTIFIYVTNALGISTFSV